MPVRTATISKVEQTQLLSHLSKHPIYPYTFRFRKTVNAANFPLPDGGLGSYFSFKWQPIVTLGVVSIATNYILTPNTTVDVFALAVSYKATYSIADVVGNTPADEASDIYELKANGGSINDFQVFYPLNWFVEKTQPLYVHVFAGAATVAAASAVMQGRITFGTLQGGI